MDAYEFMDLYSDDAELYHHGIKGQKWGVRNGPPYPLGSGKDPKVFLDKYKDQRAGDLARDWNNLTLESKINVIGVGTGAVIAVMSAIGAIGKYHTQRQNLKLEKEKEKRLQEKEKRLQEQRLEKKTKNELAGAVKKKMEDMTNAELQKEIERMRLESEYKRLDKSNESEASKFFKETGKKVAQQAISSSVSLLISRYGPNALNAIEQTAVNISNKKRSRLANDNEYDLKPSRSDLKQAAMDQKRRNSKYQTTSERDREYAIRGVREQLEKKFNRARDEVKFRNKQIRNIENALDAHYAVTDEEDDERIIQYKKTLEFAKQTKADNENIMRKTDQQLRDLR